MIPTSQEFRALPPGIRRWSTFGPWYAMFPVDFALKVVRRYSQPGELVVDPFCGRGTSIYAACALDRRALGVEINDVGWTYASTKLYPAALSDVSRRLEQVAHKAKTLEVPDLPEFFNVAYAPNVRRFLYTARETLKWKSSRTDRTAMAILVLYAHGNRDNAFSNQMRQTKAMSPEYAIRWWRDRDLEPPALDPLEFLQSRLARRYRYGKPEFRDSRVMHGDSMKVLRRGSPLKKKWSLLLTSPPYLKTANYHYDQWIRLWLLGGPPHPVVNGGENQSWFASREKYDIMLSSVFSSLAETAAANATIYVRTSAKSDTKKATIDALKCAFPKKRAIVTSRPLNRPSQTSLYNNVAGPGEVDIHLT